MTETTSRCPIRTLPPSPPIVCMAYRVCSSLSDALCCMRLYVGPRLEAGEWREIFRIEGEGSSKIFRLDLFSYSRWRSLLPFSAFMGCFDNHSNNNQQQRSKAKESKMMRSEAPVQFSFRFALNADAQGRTEESRSFWNQWRTRTHIHHSHIQLDKI